MAKPIQELFNTLFRTGQLSGGASKTGIEEEEEMGGPPQALPLASSISPAAPEPIPPPEAAASPAALSIMPGAEPPTMTPLRPRQAEIRAKRLGVLGERERAPAERHAQRLAKIQEKKQANFAARELEKSVLIPGTAPIQFGIQSGAESLLAASLHAASAVGLASRETADQMNRQVAEREQAAEALSDKDFGSRMVRGATRSITTMAPAVVAGIATGGTALAPYAATVGTGTAIGTAAATEMSSAYTEGKDAGLKGNALAAHTIAHGIIEAVPALLFSAAGKGGAEALVGQIGGDRLKRGLTDILKGVGHELLEEEVTELYHAINDAISFQDPERVSPDQLLQIALDTAGQTLLTMGAFEGAGAAAGFAKQRGARPAVESGEAAPIAPEAETEAPAAGAIPPERIEEGGKVEAPPVPGQTAATAAPLGEALPPAAEAPPATPSAPQQPLSPSSSIPSPASAPTAATAIAPETAPTTPAEPFSTMPADPRLTAAPEPGIAPAPAETPEEVPAAPENEADGPNANYVKRSLRQTQAVRDIANLGLSPKANAPIDRAFNRISKYERELSKQEKKEIASAAKILSETLKNPKSRPAEHTKAAQQFEREVLSIVTSAPGVAPLASTIESEPRPIPTPRVDPADPASPPASEAIADAPPATATNVGDTVRAEAELDPRNVVYLPAAPSTTFKFFRGRNAPSASSNTVGASSAIAMPRVEPLESLKGRGQIQIKPLQDNVKPLIRRDLETGIAKIIRALNFRWVVKSQGLNPNISGKFDKKEGFFQTRYRNAAAQVAHEAIGHAIDARYKIVDSLPQFNQADATTPGTIDNELHTLSDFANIARIPNTTPQVPGGPRKSGKINPRAMREEGFAEYMRSWVADPDLTESQYPLLATLVERKVSKDDMAQIRELSNVIRRYFGQKAPEKIASRILLVEEESLADYYKRTLSQWQEFFTRKGAKERLARGEFVPTFSDEFHTRIGNENSIAEAQFWYLMELGGKGLEKRRSKSVSNIKAWLKPWQFWEYQTPARERTEAAYGPQNLAPTAPVENFAFRFAQYQAAEQKILQNATIQGLPQTVSIQGTPEDAPGKYRAGTEGGAVNAVLNNIPGGTTGEEIDIIRAQMASYGVAQRIPELIKVLWDKADAKLKAQIDKINKNPRLAPAKKARAIIVATRRAQNGIQLVADELAGFGLGYESDLTIALDALDWFENKLPQTPEGLERKALLDKMLDSYRVYASSILDYLVDNGRIEASHRDEIIKKHHNYISLGRLMEDLDPEGYGQFVKKNGRQISGELNFGPFKGSGKLIQDPLYSLQMQQVAAQRAVEANKTRLTFYNAWEGAERKRLPGSFQRARTTVAERVEGRITKNDPAVVTFWKDGKAQRLRFHDPRVAVMLNGLGSDNGVLQNRKAKLVFQTLPGVLHWSIVRDPFFLGRNWLRGEVSVPILSPYSTYPFAGLFRALTRDKDTQRENVERYTAAGASFQIDQDFKVSTEQWSAASIAETKRIIEEGKKSGQKNWFVTPAQVFDLAKALPGSMKATYEAAGVASERSARYSVFENAFEAELKRSLQALAKGMPYAPTAEEFQAAEINAQIVAGVEARSVVDFYRLGSWIKGVHRSVLFLNPSIQGLYTLGRAAKEDPVGLVTKTLLLTMPILAFERFWNHDDEDKFKQLDANQRDLFWNFYWGDNTWLRVPKPYELGMASSFTSRLYDSMNGDEHAWDGFVKDESYSNSLMAYTKGTLPQAFTPLDETNFFDLVAPGVAELYTNWDSYRQRPIIPQREFEQDIELRAGADKGTMVGKLLAATLGQVVAGDSRQYDYWLNSQFATFGYMVPRGADALYRGDIIPDTPLASTFLKKASAFNARDVRWVRQEAAKIGATNDPALERFYSLEKRYLGTIDTPYEADAREAWLNESKRIRDSGVLGRVRRKETRDLERDKLRQRAREEAKAKAQANR